MDSKILKIRIPDKRIVLLLDRLRQSNFLKHPSLESEINDKVKAALTKRIADENVSDCKLSLIHFDHVPNLIYFQGPIRLVFAHYETFSSK